MDANDLPSYFSLYEEDKQLSAWHMAMIGAILLLAVAQGRNRQIKISRSKLMVLSHIKTLPTYHKYFKELQDMGYISYRPSYHPGVKSEVDLKKQPLQI